MARTDYVNEHIYGSHLNPGEKSAYNPLQDQQWRDERMYRRVMTELAMARFDWKGLPDDVTGGPRFIEKKLLEQALCVFTQLTSPMYGDRYFALQGSGSGRIDPYDNPTEFLVTGNSYLNVRIPRDKCVPIWANYNRVPDWDIITMFAARLANISRTITIAEMNMRNTQIVFTTENGQLSAQNIQRMRDQGDMTVYVKKNMMEKDDFQAFDMKVHPDTLPKLMLAKSKLWNEAMTLLGVNNANQDKAERVQAAEVAANDDQVEVMRRIALNSREQAVEEINRKYGLNISVEFHSEAIAAPTTDGGTDNGDIHNAIESGVGSNN